MTAVSQATAESHLAAGMVKRKPTVVAGKRNRSGCLAAGRGCAIAARHDLGMGDEFLWLAAGRLEAVKDYSTLLRALAAVPANGAAAGSGVGPLESELRQLAARLGLEQRVRFLGFEPNVERWMQAADGFVLSSRYEGLPMVLLEAGACGLPAVGNRCAGTREVIVDGETGCWHRQAIPAALSATMTRLMRMPREERSAMGERARHRGRRAFSMETVLDRWERLYAELLERNVNSRNSPEGAGHFETRAAPHRHKRAP